MTISQWLDTATKQLQSAAIPSARLDAEVMLAYALAVNRSWLIAHEDTEIDSVKSELLDTLLSRRLIREPIAYLTGKKEFYGREFTVTPDTLIPRPETETLIDIAKQLPLPEKAYAIDVGTGSGCIGLTLKAEIPQIEIIALADISKDALKVAKANNRTRFHLPGVQYYQSNLLSFWKPEAFEAPYVHLIAANLPYVDPAWERSPETGHEPVVALLAADGGLALVKGLIEQSTPVLAPGGYLLLEADPEQHEQIVSYAQNHGLELIERRGYAVLLRRL